MGVVRSSPCAAYPGFYSKFRRHSSGERGLALVGHQIDRGHRREKGNGLLGFFRHPILSMCRDLIDPVSSPAPCVDWISGGPLRHGLRSGLGFAPRRRGRNS